MTMYLFIRGRVPVVGTNAELFFATGVLPYILFIYPAHSIMVAIISNRPLLFFPIVQVLDVVVARGIVEIITAFWVTAIFCVILFVIRALISCRFTFRRRVGDSGHDLSGIFRGLLCGVMNKLTTTFAVFFALMLTCPVFSRRASSSFHLRCRSRFSRTSVWWKSLMYWRSSASFGLL